MIKNKYIKETQNKIKKNMLNKNKKKSKNYLKKKRKNLIAAFIFVLSHLVIIHHKLKYFI